MALVKAHIVLDSALQEDNPASQERQENLIREIGIQDVNRKRLASFGILTGEVDEEQIPRIRDLPEVESVQVDQVRHLASKR